MIVRRVTKVSEATFFLSRAMKDWTGPFNFWRATNALDEPLIRLSRMDESVEIFSILRRAEASDDPSAGMRTVKPSEVSLILRRVMKALELSLTF